MTDRMTTKPAGDALPPGVRIAFRDGVTRPERRVAEHSVAALVARSAEAAARARAVEAGLATLADALNAPYRKLIEEDPAATEALGVLTSGQLVELDPTNVVRRELPYVVADDFGSLAVRPMQVRVPPYDFSWSWFHGNPSFNPVLDNATGGVILEARSGSMQGGASGFVDAHAGFGLILKTDREVTATGRSFRRMRFSFGVRAIGVGGNATSEGGMEFTALEDGQLVASASAKLWRKRVSASFGSFDEEAHGREGPFAVSEPNALSFVMKPGRGYTFNVGVWVFSDRSIGAGAAAATSFILGNVLAMSVERG